MKIKEKHWLIPLIVFIICSIIVILSINKIIELAKFQTNVSVVIQPTPFDQRITELIKTPELLNYQILEKKLPLRLNGKADMTAQFNLFSQIKSLPQQEQNTIIRIKLIEWKLQHLQDQISQCKMPQNEPIIFKTLFWILSFLIWIASIVGGKMLNFLTDKYIIDKYWNSNGGKINES